MKRLVLCVAVVVLACVGRARGAPILWSVADNGNGHYYELVYNKVSWPVAKTLAEKMIYQGLPGHLVTITSAEEE